jgi:hypothetical protein
VNQETKTGHAHRALRSLLIACFPAIAAGISIGAIVFCYVAGWPGTPTLPNGVSVDGIVVTIDVEGGTIQYGYSESGEGPRTFKTVAIAEGAADPGYGWGRISSGSAIKIIYDPRDTEVSLPYITFPFWAMGAWSTVVGFVVVVFAVWIRKRWLIKDMG